MLDWGDLSDFSGAVATRPCWIPGGRSERHAVARFEFAAIPQEYGSTVTNFEYPALPDPYRRPMLHLIFPANPDAQSKLPNFY